MIILCQNISYYYKIMMNLKTPEAFWLLKNGILESYPSLSNNEYADILIVGSGITGSLIAHQCVSEGYHTILVDRLEAAHGSTSATTSMLQYEIDIPLFKLSEMIGREAAEKCYWHCHDAIDRIQDLCVLLKNKDFKKKKSLYFAAYKKDVAWLKKEFEARKMAGFEVKWLESKEIKQKFNIENTFGGILSQKGASVDAFKLTHQILKHNVKKGLKVFDKTAIMKTESKKNEIIAYTEYGNTITAKKIIYCNGYESTEIIPEKFVNLISTYAIVGERNAESLGSLNNILVWNTSQPYIYIRTTDDNRILIGGEDIPYVNPTKRNRLLTQKAKKLEKQLNNYLPEINFRNDFSWGGTFGETKDGLPYIGTHPQFKNACFVLGFGGNGITFSAIGMEMVSQFLKNEEHELAPLFRFGR